MDFLTHSRKPNDREYYPEKHQDAIARRYVTVGDCHPSAWILCRRAWSAKNKIENGTGSEVSHQARAGKAWSMIANTCRASPPLSSLRDPVIEASPESPRGYFWPSKAPQTQHLHLRPLDDGVVPNHGCYRLDGTAKGG